MDQNKSTKRLPGFYIALCCCVLAIGIAGFIAQNMESRSTNAVTTVTETETPMPPSTQAAVYVSTPEPTYQAAETATPYTEPPQTAEPVSDAASIPDYAVDNPDIEPASVVVQAAESDILADPVSGMTVIYGFSGDTLMYNDVLDDWRTHDGIDIEADIGCSVSAAAAGTVTFAGEGTLGGTVMIDHGNGLITVYSQLGEIIASEGESVSQGDVIGSIGESTGETTKGAHLHYEVHKDGVPVDPNEY